MLEREFDQFVSALSSCSRRGADASAPASRQLYDYLVRDDNRMLWRAIVLGGYICQDSRISWKLENGRLTFEGLRILREPVITVNSIPEMKRKLYEAARKGQCSLVLFMPPEMMRDLVAGGGKKLNLLEQDLYASTSYLYFENSGILYYKEFKVSEKHLKDRSGAALAGSSGTLPMLSGLRSVMDYVSARAAAGAGEISFLCTPEVFRTLTKGGYPDSSGDPMLVMEDVRFRAGIMKMNDAHWEMNGRVNIDNIGYFPGYKIIRALENGNTASLSARERTLLSAAGRLVSSIRAQGDAEKALMISHELGRITTYVDDPATDDDDCAYGPLLRNQANCDGFADAFYLCAMLAGVRARYQYGDRLVRQPGDKKNERHLWNTVCIRNQWLMLDATWDREGNKQGLDWKYCMIGEDRAKLMYRWNREALPDLAPVTDCRRAEGIREYPCSSISDVARAFRDAREKNAPMIYIIMNRSTSLPGRGDIERCLQESGVRECTYSQMGDIPAMRIRMKYR